MAQVSLSRMWFLICRANAIFLLLCVPFCASAQNTAFSSMMENNMMGQQNFNNSINGYNSRLQQQSGGAAVSTPQTCVAPYDLIHGMAGLVPPQLQGDPRFQEYLRCRYGDVQVTPEMANVNIVIPVRPAPGYVPGSQQSRNNAAVTPSAQHLPPDATDFVPAVYGHPNVDRQIAVLQVSEAQRAQIAQWVGNSFQEIGRVYRPNNLAVSICLAYVEALYVLNGTRTDTPHIQGCITGMNDSIGSGSKFALMSDADKQINYELLIYEESMMQLLKTSGERGNARDNQTAVGLAQSVMQSLNTR
jgi:hypothetical protein